MSGLPDVAIPDPASAPVLRWGVVGAGLVSGWFVRALRAATPQQVRVIHSPSGTSARALAAETGIDRVAASLEDLLADDEVDIVYVATPHPSHAEIALACLDAGKHVLVEKPFTTTAADAARVFDRAASRGLLAMDAMWTRYQPKAGLVRRLLGDGAIGVPSHVEASIGRITEPDPARRQLDPALAGGSLFEMGVYGIDAAVGALGLPVSWGVTGEIGPTGVEVVAKVRMEHAAGTSRTESSFIAEPPGFARIVGSDGIITLPSSFVTTGTVVLDDGRATWHWEDPTGVAGTDGLAWEADAAARLIADGVRQSLVHPRADTEATIAVIESARAELGVEEPVLS